MTQHDEADLLSGYLDDELDQAERARVDAHLPTCAECRETLVALRSTVVDLKTLATPEPTEQDSWALRSAIARARKPSKAWQRILFASGAVAAALVGIIAVTHQRSNGTGASALAPEHAVALYSDSQNFSALTAQNYFLSIIGAVQQTSNAPLPAARPAQPPATTTGKRSAQDALTFSTFGGTSSTVPIDSTTKRQLDRCVRIVRGQTQELLTPFRYESSSFDSTKAFFLIFKTPRRYEFWVVSRVPDHLCDVLYFSQSLT